MYFPYFLDSESVLGWVGFNYVRTIRFYLSYTSTAELPFYLSYTVCIGEAADFYGWRQEQVFLEYTRPQS